MLMWDPWSFSEVKFAWKLGLNLMNVTLVFVFQFLCRRGSDDNQGVD